MRLFVGVRHLQNLLFAELRPDQLESDREVRLREAAGEGDPARAGEVYGNGEDIGQIHFQRILRPLAELEGRLWAGGREQEIATLERLFKILPNQAPHLLSFAVISIGVAGAEDKGAQNDPAFYFRAEPFLPRPLVKIEDILGISRPASIADAVKPGPVGRGLGRREDLIDCDRGRGEGEGDLLDFSAVLLEPVGRRPHRLLRLRIHAWDKVLLG